MLDENLDTTNGQFMASLLLREDKGLENLGREIGKPVESLLGMPQEDSSSEANIQERESSEMVAATFRPEGIHGPRQLLFMEGPAVTMISYAYMEADPDFPRVMIIPWAGRADFQRFFCETESPNAEQDADLNVMLRSRMRQVLGQSVVMSPWGDSNAFQLRSPRVESPSVTVELEHPDKSTIWTEILERFNVIAQREDNWDGLESKKPIEESLVRAKRLIAKLLHDILNAGYSWHMFKPLISSDEDGYITVRWRGEGKRLHLLIEEDEMRYIKSWKINNKRKVRSDRTRSDNCFEIWKWLIDG